jgi:hypothetical protein
MDKFINDIIEEAFKSKAQQRYFYWKAGKGNKKFKKMAKEFSDKTDFSKLPEKVTEESPTDLDEIVDEDGNFISGGRPSNAGTKEITSKSTTDKIMKTGAGQMGTFGVVGGANTNKTLRYWAESDMSKALGYEDTLGDDMTYEEAKKYFKEELGLSDEETKYRLDQMGYDEKLPEEKVRLVENLNRYIEEYIEDLLSKKSNNSEILNKDENKKNINPIIKKQFKALEKTIEKNGLEPKIIIKHLLDNE